MENKTSRMSGDMINESYLRQMMNRDDRYTKRVYERSRPVSSDMEKESCHCKEHSEMKRPSGRSLAMVYAEEQKFRDIYDTKTGIGRGTIFKELDMPFMGHKEMR